MHYSKSGSVTVHSIWGAKCLCCHKHWCAKLEPTQQTRGDCLNSGCGNKFSIKQSIRFRGGLADKAANRSSLWYFGLEEMTQPVSGWCHTVANVGPHQQPLPLSLSLKMQLCMTRKKLADPFAQQVAWFQFFVWSKDEERRKFSICCKSRTFLMLQSIHFPEGAFTT